MIAMEDYFSQHELGLLSAEHFSRAARLSVAGLESQACGLIG